MNGHGYNKIKKMITLKLLARQQNFFFVVVVKPLKPCWLVCSLTVSKIREIPCSIYSTAQQYSVVAMVIIILTKP